MHSWKGYVQIVCIKILKNRPNGQKAGIDQIVNVIDQIVNVIDQIVNVIKKAKGEQKGNRLNLKFDIDQIVNA